MLRPARYVTPEMAFEFHYFFTRKFWMVYPCKALIVAPGTPYCSPSPKPTAHSPQPAARSPQPQAPRPAKP